MNTPSDRTGLPTKPNLHDAHYCKLFFAKSKEFNAAMKKNHSACKIQTKSRRWFDMPPLFQASSFIRLSQGAACLFRANGLILIPFPA
jgi:hypothetical protein